MVAERSVNLRRFMVTQIEKIRSENTDMSSDKQCENTVALSLRFPSKG